MKTRDMRTEYIKDDIARAAEIIRAGGLAAVPTETVYGMAADGLDEKAVERIYVEFALPHERDHLFGERQKTQRIGDRGSGLAQPLGKHLLREVVLLHEFFHSVCGFDGVEVLPLQVFDEGNFLYFTLVELLDDGGNGGEACLFGGAVSALACDDHISAVRVLVDDDGADHAVFLDGVGEIEQRAFVEHLARLVGIGENICERKLRGAPRDPLGCVFVGLLRVAEQRRKPSA